MWSLKKKKKNGDVYYTKYNYDNKTNNNLLIVFKHGYKTVSHKDLLNCNFTQ